MKFSDIIVCDDIRREEGGKRTLVGVYNENLIFHPSQSKPIWPVSKQLGIYFKMFFEANESVDIDNFKGFISIKPSSSKSEENKIVDFNGGIKGDFEKFCVVELLVPLLIPSPGTLIINFQIFSKGKLVEEFTRDMIEVKEAPSKKPVLA